MEAEGSARVGLSEEFASTVGEVEEIELPFLGDFMEQGSVCLRILTADGKTHTVWSPLSGTILAVNETLNERPGLVVRDPYGEGWLLRLEPGNLASELEGLSAEYEEEEEQG